MTAIRHFVFLALLSSSLPAIAHSHPNILLILTDDQGFGDVSLHGNPVLKTPHIDRIAREGARGERFFVEPVCAPTRAAVLTGRYPTRTGVHGVTRGRENLRSEESTVAEVLRAADYATGCFGKWHNGAHWPHHPNAQGFQEFFGFCGGHINDYFDPVLEENGRPVKTRGYIADVLTDRAIDFMLENVEAEKPFFCYLAYNTPHTPASAPLGEWRTWTDNTQVDDVYTRVIYAMCQNIDNNVGRLLRTLDEKNLAEDTIVLFLTDNGPNGDRFNDGMLGAKGSVMEGGVRVPLFVRWTGKIPSGTVIESNVAHIDLLPTLCAMAGVEPPKNPDRPLDGVDLSSLFLQKPGFATPDRNLFTYRHAQRWSVRSEQYRATASTLHDLVEDPSQRRNLAESLPGVHKDLIASFHAWREDAVPTELAPLPIEIGHREWPDVLVRAHELEIHPAKGEGIAYCEFHGWAHQWIDRWTIVEAYAECPISVVTPGTYRVSIQYACKPESVGSVFVLRAGKSAPLEFTITEPWVSAVFPASEQYSKRSGGYLARQWKEMDAGRLNLAEGKQTLRLEAKQMRGKAMPDIKAIRLIRDEEQKPVR